MDGKLKTFILGGPPAVIFVLLLLFNFSSSSPLINRALSWLNLISFGLLALLVRWAYWLELFLVVLVVWRFKITSKGVLYAAFGLTFLGAICDILGLSTTAETILRIGFSFWVVGILQGLKDLYRRGASESYG